MSLSAKKRVIVISIPKAGTYLADQILQRMGLRDSRIHLRYDDQAIGIYDFSGAPVKMSYREQENRFKAMPFISALSLIGKNEFVLGHLPPIPEVKDLIYKDFKIIFLVRDLRDCLISHMRYMIKIGGILADQHPWLNIEDERERFKQYLLNYANPVGPLINMKLIACWEYDLREPYPGMEIFKLKFEELTNPNTSISNGLMHHLAGFLELDCQNVDGIMQSVLCTETLTRSSEQTVRDKYWSPFAQQWFQERIYDQRGNHLNEMLGYL